jgi:ubiquinone/menaquinone biosynthesis C-methylase UbiE
MPENPDLGWPPSRAPAGTGSSGLNLGSLLARFIAANQRLSKATEDRMPARFKRHIQTLYKHKTAQLVNRRAGQVVLDIGGGKECPFLHYLDAAVPHLIIALDLSEEELRRNRQLKHKIVADAAANRFPFRDASADLVVSRSVVEHVRDNAAFFANCARVLRPGGSMVHAFPGKYAPFALVNQLLPNRLARRLVGYLHPEWLEEDNYGFLAFYDRCYFSAVRDLLDCNGFENLDFEFLYYQSIYFNFCFPLYVLMLAYDLIASTLGIRNLASGIVVTAERSSGWPERAAPHAPVIR